jgi:energy-coupling factor transporter ATP-binding protein EcfA2
MQMLVESGRPLLLVGPSGSGKSTILKEKMRVLTSGDLADWLPLIVQTNTLMTGQSVWSKMEKHLDCRSEQAYFPKESSKGLMCLVEDINTATGSSTAEFIRQVIDHGGVFDRRTAVGKAVYNVSYMLSTDTLDDTQFVTQSIQRHFGVLAFPLPDKEEMTATYINLMQAQLKLAKRGEERSALQNSMLDEHALEQSEILVKATVDLHYRITTLYLDTMARAHYVYGPRDLDTMFFHLSQVNASEQALPRASLLWATIARDVYAMRLSDSTDVSRFWDALEKTAHAFFGPELATLIARGEDAPIFRSVSDSSGMLLHGEEEVIANSAAERRTLSRTIDSLAADCYAHHPTLNVNVHKGLLAQLSHLIRMLQRPTKKSNFLLIGTGANDLAQLAGFVCQYPLTYARNLHSRTTAEFQEEFAELAMRAGTRGEKSCTLLTA